ncbi:hypothetical protein GW17_00032367, partial [Ensete ventricosum]
LDSPSAAQESPASPFATRSAPVSRRMTRSATIANMRATRSASKAGGIRLLDGLANEQLKKRKATPAKRHAGSRRNGKDKTTDDNQEKDKPSAGGAASVGPYTIFVEARSMALVSSKFRLFSMLNQINRSKIHEMLGYLFISFQPRKGCFKVHDEEGEIFLQHLVILLSWYHVMQDLEDPYTELESIDVSKVVKDVGRKIG